MDRHERHMHRCIELARLASATGDSPVGSVVVDDSEVVSEGVESVRARNDATAHAEMEALRAGFARRHTRALVGCTLYTSVEPCVMCAYAIRLARIGVVVSGARSSDLNSATTGFAILTDATLLPNHPPPTVIRDVLAAECEALLKGSRSADPSGAAHSRSPEEPIPSQPLRHPSPIVRRD